MPDFFKPADFKKLVSAVEWSEKKLGEFRADRIDVLKEFAGFNYGEESTADRVPVNTIQHGATIYHRKISVRRPQGLITTRYRELKASAAQFRLAVNQRLEQMQVESPLNEAAWEALFQLGVVKVAIDPETGDVYVESIPFEDVILDMAAKSWRKQTYIGNRYRMPLDWVKENKNFERAVRKDAQSAQGDAQGGTRRDEVAQRLAIGQARPEEYRDYCELIDVFVVDERQVVTYLADAPESPLDVMDWEGPEFNIFGPYRALKFIEVPGNVMPIGPVQAWRDLHVAINTLTSKTLRQMERQKTLLVGPAGMDEDVDRITAASDGDAIALNEDPDKYVEKTTGGANQVNLGSLGWLKTLQNWNMGNTDLIAGSGTSTDTVGQDTMLLQGAGAMVDDMQHRTMEFVRDVITDVAWWMWTDDTGYMDVAQQVPGGSDIATFRWDRKRRKGEFFQYNLDVEPYSISGRTPQQRLTGIMAAIEKILMQAGPDMQAAGMRIDWEKVIKLVADYGDMQELGECVIYMGGEMHPEGGPPSPGGTRRKPPNNKPQKARPGRPPKNPDTEFFNKMMQAGGQKQGAR